MGQRPAQRFATVHGTLTIRGKARLSTFEDPSRDLRRYTGVFLIFCGVGPLLMFSLLAAKPGGPDFPVLPVLIAAPFVMAGVVVTVTGIVAEVPKFSAQRIGVGAALIAVGVALIFGIRAVLV